MEGRLKLGSKIIPTALTGRQGKPRINYLSFGGGGGFIYIFDFLTSTDF